jgi:superfamily II DNA/RNA helicase
MKRKLDKNDRPSSAADSEQKPATEKAEAEFSFTDLGLDPRLLQAIAKQKFEKPTLVQRKAIPLALSGQDVLCKAKTGSGKTAAYVLPLLASILKKKQVHIGRSPTSLAQQMTDFASRLQLRHQLRHLSLSRHVNLPTKCSRPSNNSPPSAPRISKQ